MTHEPVDSGRVISSWPGHSMENIPNRGCHGPIFYWTLGPIVSLLDGPMTHLAIAIVQEGVSGYLRRGLKNVELTVGHLRRGSKNIELVS